MKEPHGPHFEELNDLMLEYAEQHFQLVIHLQTAEELHLELSPIVAELEYLTLLESCQAYVVEAGVVDAVPAHPLTLKPGDELVPGYPLGIPVVQFS